MDVMLKVSVEQLMKVPMFASESTCSGKVYVVTGSDTNLCLETVRHLVKFAASRDILAVRNLTAGEKAKKDIEESTGYPEVVEGFAKEASAELDRIKGFVANAGLMVDQRQSVEGMAITVFVMVTGMIFLAALVIPQLITSGRKFGIVLFDEFNDQKRANTAQRYSLSKLVEEGAVRRFTAVCSVEQTGVVMNIVAPGLCSTGLCRDTGSLTKAVIGALRAMAARTPEVGSRVILSGLVTVDETHGKPISGSKIKEHWIPS